MAQQVEPTKANLIRLKDELRLAEEGYEILDHKREILLKELSAASAGFAEYRKEFLETLKSNMKRYAEIRIGTSPRFIAYAAIPQKNALVLKRTVTGVMGLHLPKFLVADEAMPFKAALSGSPSYEELILQLKHMVRPLSEYAERFCALRRIAYELARTQKRQKALENIHIPNYKVGITFITAAIEESEREELIRYKKLKRKLSKEDV